MLKWVNIALVLESSLTYTKSRRLSKIWTKFAHLNIRILYNKGNEYHFNIYLQYSLRRK